jgi:C-terminal processing protease CtpA/Prc
VVRRAKGEAMGMGFVTEGSTHTISQLFSGGVAQRSGLVVGDIIIKVDGTAVVGLMHDAVLAIIGAAGAVLAPPSSSSPSSSPLLLLLPPPPSGCQC